MTEVVPAVLPRTRGGARRPGWPRALRDPLGALVARADRAPGAVVRLRLGPVRPFLVTEPEHVQHVLRDHAGNYLRGGETTFWRSLRRLTGEGLLSDGPEWAASRERLQPHFTAPRVDLLRDRMSRAISDAVDELAAPAATGLPVDAGRELSRIVCRAVGHAFFADKIGVADGVRVTAEQDRLVAALRFRLLAPFVPDRVPMPGDRTFRRAVAAIDEVLLPVVRAERATGGDGDDVLAALVRATGPDGAPLDERRVRDDLVALFATATDTTQVVLTWLLPLLAAHPAVEARLRAEIERVVDPAGPVTADQLTRLDYTRAVLDELLRMYPIGWLIPRTAVADDVIAGTPVPAGSIVLLSQYVTHRLARHWERPDEFDPDRFTADGPRRTHRYAYWPFGGGPHQCIGRYLFQLEAPLIVATLLSRYRVRPVRPGLPTRQLSATLRPRDRVLVTLTPARPGAPA
jgi:cytochrome P450